MLREKTSKNRHIILQAEPLAHQKIKCTFTGHFTSMLHCHTIMKQMGGVFRSKKAIFAIEI
ncbi:hypothetical protein HMPREF0645_0147 [Hallella bergensis DSM 17361]|uniref:Uncharacterized protein n=1 Tax=Hallella bergensis DSM 17361 TaxID=585502 RepID=D1PT62_9BACT|nr:hypothetical protein HMPREF0645_0147 [Hallella bergensis DSM 17361]